MFQGVRVKRSYYCRFIDCSAAERPASFKTLRIKIISKEYVRQNVLSYLLTDIESMWFDCHVPAKSRLFAKACLLFLQKWQGRGVS